MKILLLLAAAGLLYIFAGFDLQNFLGQKSLCLNPLSRQGGSRSEQATLTEVIENRKLLPLAYLNVKFQVSRNLVFQNMENTSVSDFNYKNDVFSCFVSPENTKNACSSPVKSADTMKLHNLISSHPICL